MNEDEEFSHVDKDLTKVLFILFSDKGTGKNQKKHRLNNPHLKETHKIPT